MNFFLGHNFRQNHCLINVKKQLLDDYALSADQPGTSAANARATSPAHTIATESTDTDSETDN